MVKKASDITRMVKRHLALASVEAGGFPPAGNFVLVPFFGVLIQWLLAVRWPEHRVVFIIATEESDFGSGFEVRMVGAK